MFSVHMVKVSVQKGPYLPRIPNIKSKKIIVINLNFEFLTIYQSKLRGYLP